MNQLARFTALDLPTLLSNIHRSSIGYDRMFDDLHRVSTPSQTYPPYNIVKYTDTSYVIELAVAGFREEELDVTLENNILTVSGSQENREEREYLFQGLSAKSFNRTFTLAEHVVVSGAEYTNGVLLVKLAVEVPDEAKPRKIKIEYQNNLLKE